MRRPARYRFRPLASTDIESIFATVDKDNPAAADRFISGTRAKSLAARRDARAGNGSTRTRPTKRAAELALTSFGPHVIFYLPQPDGIEVVRVLHGARNIERELRRS